MLPFTNIEFYVLFGGLILTIHALKPLYSKHVSYTSVLLIATLFYTFCFFTQTLQILIFVLYSYIVYYIFSFKLVKTNKLWPSLLLALPLILIKVHIGLSLISFAGMSYITFRTIQVFLDHQPNDARIPIGEYFTFLAFTPTLLIGPIDRWRRFKDNLNEGYKNLGFELFVDGWQNMVVGIFQKYILAELVARYWLQPVDNVHSLLEHTNAAFAYTAYLYFDFSGYSSLAVGFGNMLGVKVPQNFNHPYKALNPQDFWRRWHITLGDWLRDYFFRPIYKWLSGIKSLKQYTVTKQNVSLFLTFVLMGCWNGLSHSYIWSGVIFGVYSVIHNMYIIECKKKGKDIVFGQLSPVVTTFLSRFLMVCAAVFAIYVFSGRSNI